MECVAFCQADFGVVALISVAASVVVGLVKISVVVVVIVVVAAVVADTHSYWWHSKHPEYIE